MSEVSIKAEKRTEFKKSISRQNRNKGYIPGIFYGVDEENIPILVSELSLRPIIYSTESRIINLQIEGIDKKFSCILKDVQYDPIKDKPIHFDLFGLKEGEPIEIEVTVQLTGAAIGVKSGGIVQHILHKLDIKCLPDKIPPHIDIDISNLEIGDSIKVSDLKLEDIEILNEENVAIVAVVPPAAEKAEVQEPAAEEETAAEPEVITKGKKEEEEKS
ncbi:MAG: 50S ribosomal protein L25 [Ignavibacteria bacterium]|nr:50S ribosomal protein L25 [Ignavibacteria bacterium]